MQQKQEETYILLPGNHSLQLCQAEQQDNIILKAVEIPSPKIFWSGRQRKVRKVYFDCAELCVIFYTSHLATLCNFQNQRRTRIDVFPLRRGHSTPIAPQGKRSYLELVL